MTSLLLSCFSALNYLLLHLSQTELLTHPSNEQAKHLPLSTADQTMGRKNRRLCPFVQHSRHGNLDALQVSEILGDGR